MSFNKIINTGAIVKDLMVAHIKAGDTVLDATVGNGHDTLILSNLVGPSGRVYGYDIQKVAIDLTKEFLNENSSLDNVTLINDSHEYIDQFINKKLSFIVYNLGYLPKGDKSIKTNSKSTINSIKKALNLLEPKGLLVVTVYVGHAGGPEEKGALEDLLTSLDQKLYGVLKYDFINQANNPPILYCIEKSNKEIYP